MSTRLVKLDFLNIYVTRAHSAFVLLYLIYFFRFVGGHRYIFGTCVDFFIRLVASQGPVLAFLYATRVSQAFREWANKSHPGSLIL